MGTDMGFLLADAIADI